MPAGIIMGGRRSTCAKGVEWLYFSGSNGTRIRCSGNVCVCEAAGAQYRYSVSGLVLLADVFLVVVGVSYKPIAPPDSARFFELR